MEKGILKTGQECSSRSRSLSASAKPFLNYHSGSQHFGIPGAERMRTTSSSHQKECLMDMLWYRNLVDKHNAALFLLQKAGKEAQELRKEIINLKIVNADLCNRITMLQNAMSERAASFRYSAMHLDPVLNAVLRNRLAEELWKEKSYLESINADLRNRLAVLQRAISDRAASFGYSAMRMAPEMNVNEVLTGLGSLRMTAFGIGVNQGLKLDDVAKERGRTNMSPTPVSRINSGQIEGSGEGKDDRVPLPKSIGIRSTGYFKMLEHGGRSKGKGNKQKVCVQGKHPLELEVYYQGTSKTELCNNWQKTRACFYEEKCHFAHGVEELRPVLRHPLYKTDVCRLLLNGDPCTYGHRCHFRHTLSEKEKAIRSNNLRVLKPLHK